MLEKLTPDRDLQCYFLRPSAIAALSECSANGFTVSGSWRQQFDWAVVEWNRDNVFEHPAFRNLPDGDLSGLSVSYEETRENCIPMDSDLYPTVDWPYLRVWADNGLAGEQIYWVPLKNHATPVAGSYACATAEIELQGTITQNDYVGFRLLGEHHTHQCYFDDTLSTVASALAASVNAFSIHCTAEVVGTAKIRLTYVGNTAGVRNALEGNTTGANGNRIGLYTYVGGSGSESWDVPSLKFTGGTSPTKWQVTLDFGNLLDRDGVTVVPMTSVRKVRWTYAAELQDGAYERSEFSAVISNWTVTGTNRAYKVAGKGSQRYEDDAREVSYTGVWTPAKGNFSGGNISHTVQAGASVSCTYHFTAPHSLYIGSRLTPFSAPVELRMNGDLVRTESLYVLGEDVLVRRKVGDYPAGTHTLTMTHAGSNGEYFYFDFVEAALATTDLQTFPVEPKITLATDWDTDHSLPLAPERTAWFIHSLGFRGRHNLYVGALIFYEMYRKNHVYASKEVTFSGTPASNSTVTLTIVRDDYGMETAIVLNHLVLVADTPETIAKAFELELNRGYTALRAEADGATLRIFARAMGADGNHWTVTGAPATGAFQVQVAGPSSNFTGGADGIWRTDLQAEPRINRACRDWCRSFLATMKSEYGIDSVAAFSTELQHGDTDEEVGIAQRYPDNTAVLLNTPAIQGNFSPESIAYWRQVYRDMAGIMVESGLTPYLQFGEVQWWYFPKPGVGMTFYDAYTKAQFQAIYGRPMAVIADNFVDPDLHPEEAEFLPLLLGAYTDAIMAYVRIEHPSAKFEVLYPLDVNEGQFNNQINYAWSSWTPAVLDNLKTESFIYTGERRLEDSLRRSCDFGTDLGFTPEQRSHLIGLMDPYTAWLKEARYAEVKNRDGVVFWALDQFCLIGYPLPLEHGSGRSTMMT
jgi:hypothetical protein